VTDCLRSGWLSMGPRTRAFEDAFAEAHGVAHAFAVSSGTAALHLAYRALGIGDKAGDEIIQPAMTFVASANATLAVGAKPVFADIISLTDPTIDPAHVKALIGPKTRAVVAMHYGGYAADLGRLSEICRAHGVALIEDACHAPAQPAPGRSGRYLGGIGDIGCFSFFSNKNMTCGEGGMIVTNDDRLADRIRALRSHGMTTLSWERHKGRASSYDVTEHGYNYRLDDLRSALAHVQFEKLSEANARRRHLAALYAEAVGRLAGDRVSFVNGHRPAAGTAHVGAIVVDQAVRQRVREGLADARIQTSLHYPPIHRFSAFASYNKPLPVSIEFAARVVTLPLYPGLPDEAVEEIITHVSELTAMAQA